MDDHEKCYLVELPEDTPYIINPVLNFFSPLEKREYKVVYNPKLERYITAVDTYGTFPVYLPELGYLMSLDISSINLLRRFYQDTSDFESFVSEEEGRILVSYLHNRNQNTNRFVSYGNIRMFVISDEKLYNLYLINILNDLLTTPSTIRNRKIISPNRWYLIESRIPLGISFRATVNYNVCILFIKRETIENTKEVKVWLNNKIRLWQANAGFISISRDGRVGYHRTIIHFPDDPSELSEVIRSDGEQGQYFIALLVSFNDYTTNYRGFSYKHGYSYNINIVDKLIPLVFTPYDLGLMLFPVFIEPDNLSNELIYTYSIPRHMFDKIVRRLSKFSHKLDPGIVSMFYEILSKTNIFVKVEENRYENTYDVSIINPLLLPFLLKEIYLYNDRDKKQVLDILLEDTDTAFTMLKEVDIKSMKLWSFSGLNDSKIYSKNDDITWKLHGIGSVLPLRKSIMYEYVSIWRRLLSGSGR